MRKPKSKARRDRERRERLVGKGISIKSMVFKDGTIYLHHPTHTVSSGWFPSFPVSGSSTTPKRSRRSKKRTAQADAVAASARRSTRPMKLEF